MGYRVVDASVEKEAVRLVVDKSQPVLPVCETFGLGPAAYRSWVAAERERRTQPPGNADQDKEMTALCKRVAQLEGQVEFLKNSMPFSEIRRRNGYVCGKFGEGRTVREGGVRGRRAAV